MYTKTQWQDYPPSRSTPITAARLNNIEDGIAAAHTQNDRASSDIISLRSAITTIISTLHPDWTQVYDYENIASGSTLLDDPPTITISDVSGFEPTSDGAIIYSHSSSGGYTYFDKSRFTITAAASSVTITFGQDEFFEVGERLEIYLYLKSGGSSGRTWHGIADIGLTTTAQSVAANITANGSGTIEDFGTSWPRNAYIDSWYDYSAAVAVTDKISIYSGGQLPPAIFIPTGVAVYQNGTVLPAGFYVVLGEDNLMVTGSEPSTPIASAACRGFAYLAERVGTLGPFTSFNYCLCQTNSAVTADGKLVNTRKTYYEGSTVVSLQFWQSGSCEDVQDCYSNGDELVDLVITAARNTLLSS